MKLSREKTNWWKLTAQKYCSEYCKSWASFLKSANVFNSSAVGKYFSNCLRKSSFKYSLSHESIHSRKTDGGAFNWLNMIAERQRISSIIQRK